MAKMEPVTQRFGWGGKQGYPQVSAPNSNAARDARRKVRTALLKIKRVKQ